MASKLWSESQARQDTAPSPGCNVGHIGHSMAVNLRTEVVGNTTKTQNNSGSYGSWIPPLTGQAVKMKPRWNPAVAGAQTPDVVEVQLDHILQQPISRCIVDIGRNDFSFAMFRDNITTIYDALLKKGITVDAMALMPSDIATQTTREYMQDIHAWVKEQGEKGIKNFNVFDSNGSYGDPLNTLGGPKATPGWTYDRLHSSSHGAFHIAKPLAEYYKRILPVRPGLMSVADKWSANRLTGNMIPNGILDGSVAVSYTNQGVNGTGFSATDIVLAASSPYSGGSALSGLNLTVSKAALDEYGRPGVRLQASGSYIGDVDAFWALRWSADSTTRANMEVGQYYQSGFDVEVAPQSADMQIAAIEARMFTLHGTPGYLTEDMWSGASGRTDKGGYKASLITPPHFIPSTPGNVQVQLHIVPQQGSVTLAVPLDVTIRGMWMRKVDATGWYM